MDYDANEMNKFKLDVYHQLRDNMRSNDHSIITTKDVINAVNCVKNGNIKNIYCLLVMRSVYIALIFSSLVSHGLVTDDLAL